MVTTDQEEVLQDLIAELVSIDTENPPGNEEPCSGFIVEWFDDQGIDASLVTEPYPDRPQVGVRIGEGKPELVLNGHIDVVPASPDEWTYDPYGSVVEDGNLYGRGSVDMKTGVAIGMMTTALLADEVESDDLPGSIVFQAAIGEETAEPGTKKLLEEGYDGDYGVVLEPTGMETTTSEKGLAWYEITVDGDPSHASRPDQGTNAIELARPVLEALSDYDSEIRTRDDELVGTAYATVTMFEAGTKENVIPESATITVDRRFLPEETATEVDAEISSLLEEVAAETGADVSWERTVPSRTCSGDPPPTSPVCRRSRRASLRPPMCVISSTTPVPKRSRGGRATSLRHTPTTNTSTSRPLPMVSTRCSGQPARGS